MYKRNNVNDNVKPEIKTTMSMNNDNVDKSKVVDMIALRLIEKWGVDKANYWAPMCNIAWKLPEHLIWDHYDAAQKGKNPMGLFMWLCKRSGA